MTAEELAKLLQPAVGLMLNERLSQTVIAVRVLQDAECEEGTPKGSVILQQARLVNAGPVVHPDDVEALAWYAVADPSMLLLDIHSQGHGPRTVVFTGPPEAVAAALARIIPAPTSASQ